MARQIIDSEGNAVEGILVGAFDKKTVIQIQNRLLSGDYVVQTIGQASTEIEVEFYCLKTERRHLETEAANGALITIEYDTDSWTGIVADGMIDYDPAPPQMYKLKFVLLVVED